MKYKVVKTDLQIDNKLHSEGSEVELTKEQTKGIENYLIPIEPDKTKNNEPSTKYKKRSLK